MSSVSSVASSVLFALVELDPFLGGDLLNELGDLGPQRAIAAAAPPPPDRSAASAGSRSAP